MSEIPPRVALLFPGQGALRVNHGAELLGCFPRLREELARYSDVVDMDLLEAARQPLSEMVRTSIAQRLVVGWGLALWRTVLGDALATVAVAGHSVGELAAAAASGAMDPDDALELVAARADAMAELGETGTMSAIDGIERGRLEALLSEEFPEVTVGLHNGPRSLVITGPNAGIERVEEQARTWGAMRVRRLAVGGAFHSPAMRPAMGTWRRALAGIELRSPTCPVIRNVDGAAVLEGEAISSGLEDQLDQPVEWYSCVRNLALFEPTDVVEVGCSSSLVRSARQTVPTACCWSLSRPRDALHLHDLWFSKEVAS